MASASADFRIGQGFDMHPLRPGKGLMLGGLFVSCPLAVEADSDGDVLLHALADAMLGAAGLDDIGEIYPPGSPQGKDLAGSQLIADVCQRLDGSGFGLVQADTTVVCQLPRLAPHRQQMRKNMAQMLQVEAEMVNVKATTTDGLGVTGSGEGIAAFAVVLLQCNR